MRFLGLGLADTVPDANTMWSFREALTEARIAGKPAIEVLFTRFDAALSAAGFLAMSGPIVDASIVAVLGVQGAWTVFLAWVAPIWGEVFANPRSASYSAVHTSRPARIDRRAA